MTLRGSRGDEALLLNAELRDDHACGFRGENLSEGNKFTVRFPNYPRNENTFFFNIGKESDDGQVIIPYSSFTLTNLFKQTPDQFKVEPFPAKRELDLITVSLPKLDGGYPQFEFFKNGKPNESWHENYVQLVDRFGNKGSALSEFCAKETKFKVRATFSRDATADYSAEEKWEVKLDEIPAPGKFVELNQTKIVNGMRVELVAITGTGEFTYKDGTVTTATATIETNKPASRFKPLNIPEEDAHFPKPKVYLKGEQHLGGPVFGRPFRREEVIVSKVPHVAVRIPSEDNALEFAFQEQDTSSHGAAYSTHQDGLRFFPIDLAKFAATKKLTFTVQKLREAEFIVEVPARISQKQE